MRLLLQGFPAREMRFGDGTRGRMSVVHPLLYRPLSSRCGPPAAAVPMQSLRHLHSAITSHIKGCGISLETALQAEQCQMADGGQEEYSTAQ